MPLVTRRGAWGVDLVTNKGGKDEGYIKPAVWLIKKIKSAATD